MLNGYSQDLAELIVKRRKSGHISRRAFLEAISVLGGGLAAQALVSDALAEERTIVVATYSADSNRSFDLAWGKPFSAESGADISFDAVTPVEGKIISMVESGQISWDICDSEGFSAISLGRDGYLAPIDYTVVDKSLVREGWAWEYGIANHTYAHVLAYDRTRMPRPPESWADFFNVSDFPGKRTAWKYMIGALEAALVADGVSSDALYPLDVDRAIGKYKAINSEMIYWSSGAEAVQLFLDGEVIMGNIWHNRARMLHEETGGRIDFIWTGGILCPSSWVVPVGGKNIPLAQKFIQSSLKPERQLIILQDLYNGPTNPATSLIAPEELKRYDPGHPDNVGRMIVRNEQWYADNYNDVLEKFITEIPS